MFSISTPALNNICVTKFTNFFSFRFYLLFSDVSMNSKVMTEEIFGPLLPVLKYKDINAVIKHIKENEKPLTLYIFARNRRLIDRYGFSSFLQRVSIFILID